MKPLAYSVAIDPGRLGWLVLQESSDFEGWVIVAKAKTQEEAKAFGYDFPPLGTRFDMLGIPPEVRKAVVARMRQDRRMRAMTMMKRARRIPLACNPVKHVYTRSPD